MKYLTIITTYLCNMSCPFCLFYKNKRKSINLELFKKTIKQAKSLGYGLIHLTGGEPCTHPIFDDLIKVITNENLKFGISSNGYNYAEYMELLKKYKKYFNRITFSLDSHKGKVHNKLRKKDSFKRVIEAIKLFTGEGVNVNISICLNKENFNGIEDYIYFVDKLKVKNIRFLSVIPTEKNKKYVLTDKERAECCEKINHLRNKVKTNLKIMSSLSTAKGVNFCRALNLTDLTVNPNGELIFCCDINENGAILGSLKKKNLSELIKKGKEVSEFLKEKRLQHYLRDEFFEGFNTCYFCNESLKKKINF